MRRSKAAEVVVVRKTSATALSNGGTNGELWAAVDPICSMLVQTPALTPQTDHFERTQK